MSVKNLKYDNASDCYIYRILDAVKVSGAFCVRLHFKSYSWDFLVKKTKFRHKNLLPLSFKGRPILQLKCIKSFPCCLQFLWLFPFLFSGYGSPECLLSNKSLEIKGGRELKEDIRGHSLQCKLLANNYAT